MSVCDRSTVLTFYFLLPFLIPDFNVVYLIEPQEGGGGQEYAL